MILSDWEIIKLLREGKLMRNWAEEQITPNGYDVRVEEVMVNGEKTSLIPPKTYFLVSTVEYFIMPDDLVGLLWLKTRWTRRGIIGSFGVVDAGFEGNLTLTGFNASDREVEIKSNTGFAPIVFTKLASRPEKLYHERSGTYHKSKGIVIK